MNDNTPYFPAVVIGGGVCGLRAAFDLKDLGVPCLVIEKSDAAGGKLLRLERWFTEDSCGLCRILDSEKRPLLPRDEDEILCLRRNVARRDIDLWTGSRVVGVSRTGEGLTLQIERNGKAAQQVSCDAAIVAAGMDDIDMHYLSHLRAGLDPDVVSGERFEEMIARAAQKPLRRPSDGRRVEKIAFIGCAGSRDAAHPWCSSACCGYLVKEISLLAGVDGGIKPTLFCMDVRLHAKGMHPYGEKALSRTRVVRARAGSLERKRSGMLAVRAVSDEALEEIEVDLAVLSGGVKPGSADLFSMLGVNTDRHGFPAAQAAVNPTVTSNPSVFVAGAAKTPCDIASSVMEARAAAAAVFDRLAEIKPDITGFAGKGGRALVIGGGAAGLAAAKTLAAAGHEVTVLEKQNAAGGMSTDIRIDPAGRDAAGLIEALAAEVAADDRVRILSNTEAIAINGRLCNFSVLHNNSSTALSGHFDTVVVAAGASLHRDERLDNGKIITLKQMESKLHAGDGVGGDVVFIQCAGSRDADHPYCNAVCCPKALALGMEILKKGPRAWILYRDMMTAGRDEALYTRAREAGVIFVRYEPARAPALSIGEGGAVRVEVEETTLGRKLVLSPELVVLSSGIDPPAGVLASLQVPVGGDGFAAEDDPRFRPCQSTRKGIYVAGNARYPASSSQAALQGICAGMGASILGGLARTVSHEVEPSRTREKLCAACAVCVDACPAGARFLDSAIEPTARVEARLCQACGLCAAACPSGAAVVPGAPLRAP
ncbi:MAG: FAD-dependent oxidoreductase [Pseudomonadota bacterium]